jgi:uncharacterized protein YjbI with pentapeptide repeats
MPLRLIKPMTLGALSKAYTCAARHRLSIAVLAYFELGRGDAVPLSDAASLPRAFAALPAGEVLDSVYPKARAEVLLAGKAYAPQGRAVSDMRVRLTLGAIDKSLRVRGDRARMTSAGGTRFGDPAPFLEMPLDWTRAYGGPGHPENAVGVGYSGRDELLALPNIEDPRDEIRRGDQRTPPAGFGPRSIHCPDRQVLFGTFDEEWRRRYAPHLPADFDPAAFNAAPADQQLRGWLEGGESYCLEGLHALQPRLEGRLPDLRVRVFVQRQGEDAEAAQEVAAALDTVWLLPDAGLGVSIYRACVDCSDSDAEDIVAVLAAYESRTDAPRKHAHYRRALALRTAPTTRHLHAFNDGPLMAEPKPEVVAARRAARELREAAALAALQAELDAHEKALFEKAGIARPPGYAPPKAEPSPLPQVTLDDVVNGDVDLGEVIERAKALAADAERRGKQQLAEMQDQIAKGDPALRTPPPNDEREAEQIALARARGERKVSLQTVLQPPVANGLTPEQCKDIAAATAVLEDAERQARLLAVNADDAKVPARAAAALRDLVSGWLDAKAPLAGRDLRGADLHGLDFSGLDLSGCDLAGADLRGCRFDGAKLLAVRMTGAQLDEASLCDADLSRANLNRASALRACLRGARLERTAMLEARMAGADLCAVRAHGLQAVSADWSEVQLDDAVLEECTLVKLQAPRSRWSGAQLSRCPMIAAELADAVFHGARLDRVILCTAQAPRSRWHGARFVKTLLNLCNLETANFSGVLANLSSFRDSALQGSDWREARLLRSDLSQARMERAILAGASFAHCLLMRTVLQESDARGADFFQALLRKADFRNADLRDANLVRALDAEADYRDARLDGAQRTALGEAA